MEKEIEVETYSGKQKENLNTMTYNRSLTLQRFFRASLYKCLLYENS